MNMYKFVSILFFILLTVSKINAQTRSLGSDGILGRLQEVINEAESRDMEVVRIEADIIRTEKESIRILDPKFTYGIIAVASNRIQDVDVEVYKKVNNNWTLIKKDDDAKNVAAVYIKPLYYSEYKIVVKVYQFKSGFDVGHYGLTIFHD
jgi:hypothetical protein